MGEFRLGRVRERRAAHLRVAREAADEGELARTALKRTVQVVDAQTAQNPALDVARLQRLVGNQAVARRMSSLRPPTGVAATLQRKPPRRTEESILGGLDPNAPSLSDEDSEALLTKMGKGQEAKKARAIAAQTEAESERLVSGLPAPQQAAVRKAIKDYVASSAAIQTDARANPNAPNASVQALDAALMAIRAQIAANANERITYRSISYDSAADIPYGQATAAGTIINAGDFVGDLGFMSTSEHRQFILGKEQSGQVQGLLKLAIHGRSGVPIAIHFPITAYSNTNKQALYDMQEASKGKLVRAWNAAFGPGAEAGQAEVLFPRNSVFQVKKIERAKSTVSVVLEEFVGPRPNPVLGMKFGTPI